MKLQQLKDKLRWLTASYTVCSDPRVKAAIKLVEEENAPKILELKAQIEALRSKRSPKAPRWPENTPPEVLERAKEFWRGTTELGSFRIHYWNDVAFWTGYPSGGYSDNGGWNPTPAAYELVSMTEMEHQGRTRPKCLASLAPEPRGKKNVMPKEKMLRMLDEVAERMLG